MLTAQERNERTDGSARRENSCSSAAPSFSISGEKSCAQYLLPERSSRITSTSGPSRAGGANGLRRMRASARASVKGIELSWVGNGIAPLEMRPCNALARCVLLSGQAGRLPQGGA
jgi:hypothetical protein